MKQNKSTNTRSELTKNELTVLKLIAKDLSTEAIASKMGYSKRTVDAFRSSLLRKTGTATPVGLLIYALKKRIIKI